MSSLPEEWYNHVLDMYKEGASDVEIKALIYSWRGSFSNDLWDRWMQEEEVFSETIKMGKILSECWWSKSGRKNLENKDFSYTGWYMNMKNRFNWTDKRETTVEGGKNPLVLNSQINLLEKLSKEQLRQLLEDE